MRKILLPLFILLLTGINTAFAQRVDVDKKSGLITVDGKPSFYLMGKNRSLLSADYALENLQHQELAYLKVQQQQVYSPATNTTSTESYYTMTFTKTGNSCELHGYTSFSVFKSLAKTIAAARLVQNDDISVQEERKFIVINNGMFLQDPNGGPRGDDRGGYAGDDRGRGGRGRDDRAGDDRGGRDDRDPRGNPNYDRNRDDRNNNAGDDRGRDDRGGRDDRNADNGRGNVRDDRAGDDRGGRDDRGHGRNDDNAVPDGPAKPIVISITNGRIYDGDELIGTYKQTAGKKKGDVIVSIVDVDSHKIGTATRGASATDWSITLADGKKLAVRYRAESPLVKLFQFLAEKGNL